MKLVNIVVVPALLMLFIAGNVAASDLFVYPKAGQSAEQTEKDKFECYGWAKQNSGFDPMAMPTASSPPPSGERKSGGLLKGGLGGAALGALVSGGSRQGIATGALAGGAIGGIHQSSRNSKADQQQAQWEREQAAQYSNNRNDYNRAYSACMEGRNYTVN